ncbi:type VI secretion system Vgr family protein [Pseudomonas sp. NA-150]|uniref:type VI secretion system Vgr family protein n=1 Tax=Pseudomonas sp. NA-150 TaxID=3367525 RepID=UPI0037C86E43
MGHTETLISLTIADSRLQLHVVRFSGHEALNQPYRFDVDLIGLDPYLDIEALALQSAFLSFGEQASGIHGLISHPQRLYAGTDLGYFRISLVPRLSALQNRRQRRIFQALSAPQIIVQLLEEHGIDHGHYLFEQAVGVYPPRASCTQYDESDLQLLQRLCEEEGITYRFEHSRSQHWLIFADDPGCFPEQPLPARFYMDDGRASLTPTISHLAERFTPGTSYSSHDGVALERIRQQALNNYNRTPVPGAAANQAPVGNLSLPHRRPEDTHRQQVSERRLERLRCERRHVLGRSHLATLVSGQILRVFGHPESVFNDQWLMVDIRHAGKQPDVLEAFDAVDLATIFDHDPASPEWPALTRGYRNQFRAIPWSMPYRPSLTQRKPQVHGYQTATLLGPRQHAVKRDAQGRVQARFHWPPHATENGSTHWLPLAIPRTPGAKALIAGTQVLVNFFDNDPDRPVICEVIESSEAQTPRPQVRIDGLLLEPVAEHIHLSKGQTLHVRAAERLRLEGPHTAIELHADGVRISGPQSLASALNPPCDKPRPAAADLSALFQWLERPFSNP